MISRKRKSGSAILDFVAPGLRQVFSTRAGRRLALVGTVAVTATAFVREHGSPLSAESTRLIRHASASVSDAVYDTADALLGPASDVVDAKVDGMTRFLERRFREVRSGLDNAVIAVDRRVNPDDYSEPLGGLATPPAGRPALAEVGRKPEIRKPKTKPASARHKAARSGPEAGRPRF